METDTPIPSSLYSRTRALVRLGYRSYGPYKWQILVMLALGLVGGVLEGVGVDALIPLVTLVLGQTNSAEDAISSLIHSAFLFAGVPFVPKFLLTFIVLLFFAQAIVGVFINYIRIRITAKYEQETRTKLFVSLLRSSWPHLLKERLGHLEALMLVDIPGGKEVLARIGMSISLVTSLLMYLIVAFNISPFVTLITFLSGACLMILFRPLSTRIRRYSTLRANLQHEVAHYVGEHISGMKSVKATGVEERVIEKSRQMFIDLRTYSIYVELLVIVAILLVPPLAVLYIAGMFALAFRTSLLSVAALPAIVYLVYRIFSYVQQLQNSVQVINQQLPYLRNVVAYEDSAIEKVESTSGTLPFLFSGELKFDHVNFAYEQSKQVLHGLNFSILKGDMTGIIGPSGAGKTTCVDLLLRLLVPTHGALLLDGVDSREISLSAWRQKIGYVSQDLFLIQDTIANNIRFYDDSITEDDIWAAARLAHVDEFIEQSPLGLNTPVGERGIELSAGQRQRLVIARALARKPEILILDEATSALDTESEMYIEQALQELKGSVTVIAIAHRLSTIMNSDRLLVLKDGALIEEGTPAELLSRKDSYFFKVSNIVQ